MHSCTPELQEVYSPPTSSRYWPKLRLIERLGLGTFLKGEGEGDFSTGEKDLMMLKGRFS